MFWVLSSSWTYERVHANSLSWLIFFLIMLRINVIHFALKTNEVFTLRQITKVLRTWNFAALLPVQIVRLLPNAWQVTLKVYVTLTRLQVWVGPALNFPQDELVASSWPRRFGFAELSAPSCPRPRAAVGMEIPNFPWEFPWVWVWERWWIPMGTVGILREFLSGCEIKQKRVKYVINVTVDVWISSNSQILNLFQWHFWIFLHYRIVTE